MSAHKISDKHKDDQAQDEGPGVSSEAQVRNVGAHLVIGKTQAMSSYLYAKDRKTQAMSSYLYANDRKTQAMSSYLYANDPKRDCPLFSSDLKTEIV